MYTCTLSRPAGRQRVKLGRLICVAVFAKLALSDQINAMTEAEPPDEGWRLLGWDSELDCSGRRLASPNSF